MWIAMEAYNVVIRNETINNKFPWWMNEFIKNPYVNFTLCSDDNITRISFLNTSNINDFITYLEKYWFISIDNNWNCIDICVCNNQWVLKYKCDWLIFSKVTLWIGSFTYDIVKLKWEEDILNFVYCEWIEDRVKSLQYAPELDLEKYEIISKEEWVMTLKDKISWKIVYTNY